MRRILICIVGLVTVGAGLYVLTSELAIHRELETLKRSVKSLEVSPARSARPLIDDAPFEAHEAALPIPQVPPANTMGATGDKPKERAPAGDRAVEAPTMEEVNTVVLSAYRSEHKDPSWATAAARELDISINKVLPEHSRVLSIECRTTMCRVEVEHESNEAAQSVLSSGFRDGRGEVLVADEHEKDGRLTQTLIPMRENTTPPYVGL